MWLLHLINCEFKTIIFITKSMCMCAKFRKKTFTILSVISCEGTFLPFPCFYLIHHFNCSTMSKCPSLTNCFISISDQRSFCLYSWSILVFGCCSLNITVTGHSVFHFSPSPQLPLRCSEWLNGGFSSSACRLYSTNANLLLSVRSCPISSRLKSSFIYLNPWKTLHGKTLIYNGAKAKTQINPRLELRTKVINMTTSNLQSLITEICALQGAKIVDSSSKLSLLFQTNLWYHAEKSEIHSCITRLWFTLCYIIKLISWRKC